MAEINVDNIQWFTGPNDDEALRMTVTSKAVRFSKSFVKKLDQKERRIMFGNINNTIFIRIISGNTVGRKLDSANSISRSGSGILDDWLKEHKVSDGKYILKEVLASKIYMAEKEAVVQNEFK